MRTATEKTIRIKARRIGEKIPTLGEFLEDTNGRCRERTFGHASYSAFLDAVNTAINALGRGKHYFAEASAGGVANSYGYKTTSARWGVYVEPDMSGVFIEYDRIGTHSRHTKSVYDQGHRGYVAACRRATDK